MSEYTPNFGLEKPGFGEHRNTWNVVVNSNMDIIDSAIGSKNIDGGSASAVYLPSQRIDGGDSTSCQT